MRRTERDDWRVKVVVAPRNLADLGLGDAGGRIVSPRRVEVTIAPQRLGDLGGLISMSDSLASRDVEGDYRRRCEGLLADLMALPQVMGGEVTCTETHSCSHCQSRWEVLTAEDVRDPELVQDEHSIEGEPVCCEAAVAEFRQERGIGQVGPGGGSR